MSRLQELIGNIGEFVGQAEQGLKVEVAKKSLVAVKRTLLTGGTILEPTVALLTGTPAHEPLSRALGNLRLALEEVSKWCPEEK